MSGVCFVYYLRFWFGTAWPEARVGWTPYNGHQFFDYVAVWLEYTPWFALLVWEGLRTGRIKAPTTLNPIQGSQ
uniref:Uncharacterized protein n=1 Tax=Schlesneria paludicola TaxID=360056 RepID=A0A7C2K086_9PLAN